MRNSSRNNYLSVAIDQVPYAPEYRQFRQPDVRRPDSANGQKSLPAIDARGEYACKAPPQHDQGRSSIELMGMLAHEIRNPLSAISNGIDLLTDGSLDAMRLSDLARMMQRQVSQVASLLDDLSDGVHLTRSTLAIDHIPVDCTEIALRALDTIGPMVKKSRHTLTTSLPPPGTAWVRGDQARLIQVLVNLLSNAAKYTPVGGRIALNIAADAKTVTITVRDSGMGIPHDSLQQIFNLFAQGEQPSAMVNRGMGLGLCLVQHLVELHGGTVSAFSAGSDQGSTLTVTLPRIASESDIATV